MSKGSNKRPLQISLKEFNKRWDKAFGKKDTKKRNISSSNKKTGKI